MAAAMIGRPSRPYRPARGHDTWTYITAAYFPLRIVVILLGL
jgi:hypothetical protein